MAEIRQTIERTHPDRNQDPLSGEPGAHPVATGVGAAVGGGAVGAAAGLTTAALATGAGGAVGGPVGAVAGAIVGGIAGGLIGKQVAESTNPPTEDSLWREHYGTRPYVDKDLPYEEYRPAYHYGWQARERYRGREFDEIEAHLSRDWPEARATSKLDWERARPAVRDAWEGGPAVVAVDSGEIDLLNDLLKGERAAVETYGQALDRLGSEASLRDLGRLSEAHRQAVRQLEQCVEERGGKPVCTSGAWGSWAQMVEGTAKAFGMKAALKALKEGEEHGAGQYEKAVQDQRLDADTRTLISATLLPQTRMHISVIDRLMNVE
jgi:uncharacterized protein (TIGR02284 family)